LVITHAVLVGVLVIEFAEARVAVVWQGIAIFVESVVEAGALVFTVEDAIVVVVTEVAADLNDDTSAVCAEAVFGNNADLRIGVSNALRSVPRAADFHSESRESVAGADSARADSAVVPRAPPNRARSVQAPGPRSVWHALR
jgi:hypothetical protein